MTDYQPITIEPGALLPTALSTAVSLPTEQNPASIYLASLNRSSRRTMRTALNTLGSLLGVGEIVDSQGHDVRCFLVLWGNLRAEHTGAIRTKLEARYAPATTNKLLVALRRVLKEARRLGQISADDYDRAVDLPSIPAEHHPRGRSLTDAEITALMRKCADDSTPAGARDAAIIALLRGTGLRRSEAVALDLADYDPSTGALTIRSKTGKKDRLTYVAGGAKDAIDEWLRKRGNSAGPLFYGITKGGRLVERRLADQALAIICAARATQAGIAPFTPHDMRHTFISGLLEAGADIALVQRLAGHENPATTSRYDGRGEAAKQRAVQLVHVPFFPRREAI